MGRLSTGVAENVEYVLTPAVIVFFIGAYLTAIFVRLPPISPSGGPRATRSSSG